ncbi:YetF domain-containing protein [Alkalibacillus aidingensis]|uniref:YetF domain-containing protein n=1 Tax=Alkalibacillus aidingensis TaxID=2747607 RepID=UPI00374E146B
MCKTSNRITFLVIIEGEVYEHVISEFNLDKTWLEKKLIAKDVNDVKDVFYASINRNLNLHVTLYHTENVNEPPIEH